ncbi:aldehyde dehydrogenase family protein, partial [Amaricoccus sp.]|uniref:aldehyde dehydrogenase family protein n=1 Tax=Amaricoccus sp. TaxID=1872485 RepID=UPI002BC3DCBE
IATLIAETGGQNAMIVDSTALTEQVVRDVLASAFQSAGQRCSALRVLYVQDEARARVLEMLSGAMEVLAIGDPWDIATDVGPVIDSEAEAGIRDYLAANAKKVLKTLEVPQTGRFVPPTIIAVDGIGAVEREVFGPVLHLASFRAAELDRVVDAINGRGFGLTCGLHSRIDDRVERVTARLHMGNTYVNRNQIGAIVGSQPFGGEGMSGTGPKAGGPFYLARLQRPAEAPEPAAPGGAEVPATTLTKVFGTLDAGAWAAKGDRIAALRAALGADHPALSAAAGLPAAPMDLPGPTGESNRLGLHPRGRVLCLGADGAAALAQALQALALGNPVLVVAPGAVEALRPLLKSGLPLAALDGHVAPEALTGLPDLALVAARGPADWLRALRRALAARPGAIVPLETAPVAPERYAAERHLCIDTTAAGGNASLLAASA